MDLNDYDYDDDYAPRQKASQRVARANRARVQDEPDEAPARPAPQHQQLIVGAVGVLAVIGVLFLVLFQHGAAPTTPLQIPPTIAATDAPAAPTAAAALVPTIALSTHVASAYAAPDGAVLGPVDLAGEVVTAVGRAGSAWVQLERGDRSRVWFRRADLPGNLSVPESLPDLAPVAADIAPQAGQGLTLFQGGEGGQVATPTPEPAAPPAEPTATAVWPTSAPASAPDFEKPDIRDRCQLIGCLGQQAVDLARAETCHALYWQYGDADSETIAEPDLSAVRGCIWEGLYK